ncbi:uncharacterized protein LOC144478562 [Augochlora pura]
MTGQGTFMNSSNSFLRDMNNELRRAIFSNNFKNSDEPSPASDIQKLSSNIIFSDNITRKSLLHERNVKNRSNGDYNIVNDDDVDDEFFEKIKLNIDRNLSLQSIENYKSNCIQQNHFSLRNKRPVIDDETLNVIKRFKKDTNAYHTNFIKTPTNINTSQSNSFIGTTMKKIPEKKQSYPSELSTNINAQQSDPFIDTTMREIPNKKQRYPWKSSTSINDTENCVKQQNATKCVCNVPTNINNGGNILKQQNIFTSDVINTHIRNPDKCGCKMNTKIKQDILPLLETETTVVRTKRIFFYATSYI